MSPRRIDQNFGFRRRQAGWPGRLGRPATESIFFIVITPLLIRRTEFHSTVFNRWAPGPAAYTASLSRACCCAHRAAGAGRRPGIAGQIRVLEDDSSARRSSDSSRSLVEAERGFLDGPVLAVGRSRITVADERVLVGGVDGGIFPDIVPAVIRIEQRVVQGVLETADRGGGVQRRRAAIRPHDQVGRVSRRGTGRRRRSGRC